MAEEQAQTPTQETIIEPTDLEKLKAKNDEFEKELVRAREQRAEKQKLEAEALIGGTSGGHVEAKPKEVDPKEYAEQALAGEIGNGKE